jgi:hypothetical protein
MDARGNRGNSWRRGLVAAALVVALTGGLLAGPAWARPATVAVGSDSGRPGEVVTVPVTVLPGPGEQVGALQLRITYDASRLAVASCQVSPSVVGACNSGTAGVMTLGLVAATGMSGQVAQVGFRIAPDAAGTVPLTVNVDACADPAGGRLSCAGSGGSMVVLPPAGTTPPPVDGRGETPTPTAQGTATPTRGALAPETGGPPPPGGPRLPALLAVVALALLGGGGALLAMARRGGPPGGEAP